MRRLLPTFLCCLATAGCAVHQVQHDQEQIRRALLELYTDQIMDNLVRASQGLPIIQLDYNNAQATITVNQTTGTSDSLVTTHNKVGRLSLPGFPPEPGIADKHYKAPRSKLPGWR